MLSDAEAVGGFAVGDLEEARRFYGERLGLDVEILDEDHGLLSLHLAGGRDILISASPTSTPRSTSCPRAGLPSSATRASTRTRRGSPAGRDRTSPGSRIPPATSSPFSPSSG
jgi:catechol 2,3-dioxygenase-like lactoylglutathione lyase family enzyme